MIITNLLCGLSKQRNRYDYPGASPSDGAQLIGMLPSSAVLDFSLRINSVS